MTDNVEANKARLAAIGFPVTDGGFDVDIRQDGNPILREIAKPITDFTTTFDLASVMLAVMRKAGGVGLAAPQIGHSVRLIVASIKSQQTLMMANPEIYLRRGKQTQPDGCLSVDRKKWGARVTRALEIHVRYNDVKTGELKRMRLRKIMAFIVQHEIDHLNGILFSDHFKEKSNAKTSQPDPDDSRPTEPSGSGLVE